jgi:carboxyvinyl-carboxyphosphonate phosphorylmutase
VGYELGFLAGSVSASTTLAAPDICLQTLTEFSDQIRRIMRVSNLSLLVDADHGYGNALNVIRAIQELEHAGVSALTIEDTLLPRRFGQPDSAVELVSANEMVGKLRAALEAREDPALVIVARIAGLKAETMKETVERTQAYAETGVDAIYITGLKKIEELEAIRKSTSLPFIVGTAPATLTPKILEPYGVRLLLHGHQALAATVKALSETYTHLFKGGAPTELAAKIASSEEMENLLRGASYKKWQREYLR